MKKFLALVLAFSFCLALVSCGNNGGTQQDTTAVTTGQGGEQTDPGTTDEKPKSSLPEGINPDDYYKFVQFELPEDFRQAAVDHMRKQASIVWSPKNNFGYKHDFGDWKFELNYTVGTTYTGLPYAAMMSTIEEFQKVLKENKNKYPSTADSYYDVMGVQCNTSITHSMQQFTPRADGTSRTFMPSFTDEFFGKICGNYKVPAGVETSAEIINANTQDVMYQAYSAAKKGDVIMTKDEPRGVSHLRMVVDCVITEKNGKINPNRSYLVTIEQTDTFDATRTDTKTTWWVDHQYTFTQLLATNYIPVTIEEYETGVSVIPYLALDSVSESSLSNGMLSGTVSSDYPIKYCYVSLYNKNGKLVNRVIQQDPYDTYKINLRKHSFNLFNESIVAGEEYTLLIEAGLCAGNAELCRVNFKYK